MLTHIGLADDLSDDLALSPAEHKLSRFPSLVDQTVLAYHALPGSPGLTAPLVVAMTDSISENRDYVKRVVYFSLITFGRSNRDVVIPYLHRARLGKMGNKPVIGFAQGAMAHFGVPHTRVNLGEVALLAQLAASTQSFPPHVDPDKSLRIREGLLLDLKDIGYLSQSEYEQESAKALSLASDHIPIN